MEGRRAAELIVIAMAIACRSAKPLQWKVFPAEIRKMKGGPDLDGDGKPDYQIVTGRKILKAFFDIAFRFEMVDGKPLVRSEPPKGATVQ